MTSAERTERITHAADAVLLGPCVRADDAIVYGVENSEVGREIRRLAGKPLSPETFRLYCLGLVHVGWELREAVEFDDLMRGVEAGLEPLHDAWHSRGAVLVAGAAALALGFLAGVYFSRQFLGVTGL